MSPGSHGEKWKLQIYNFSRFHLEIAAGINGYDGNRMPTPYDDAIHVTLTLVTGGKYSETLKYLNDLIMISMRFTRILWEFCLASTKGPFIPAVVSKRPPNVKKLAAT